MKPVSSSRLCRSWSPEGYRRPGMLTCQQFGVLVHSESPCDIQSIWAFFNTKTSHSQQLPQYVKPFKTKKQKKKPEASWVWQGTSEGTSTGFFQRLLLQRLKTEPRLLHFTVSNIYKAPRRSRAVIQCCGSYITLNGDMAGRRGSLILNLWLVLFSLGFISSQTGNFCISMFPSVEKKDGGLKRKFVRWCKN